MNKYPNLCVIDTNVPIIANRIKKINQIPKDELKCALEAVIAIEEIIKSEGLVIDSKNEIFDEYRNKLSLKGQLGVGDKFLKWVNDKRYAFPPENRVDITKNNDSYDEFPKHKELENFDISDRKFIAVSNAHINKPPIIQGTDSKWWGWKNGLSEVGISVIFLCEKYIENKYNKKMN